MQQGDVEAVDFGDGRRGQILRVAAEVFADQGFRNTTVRDIADRVGMLSGSLFYHFRTKTSIVEELVVPVFTTFVDLTASIATSDASAAEKVQALSTGYVLGLSGDSYLPAKVLFNDWMYLVADLPELQVGLRAIGRDWLRVIEAGVRSGEVRDDIDVSVVFHVVRGIFNHLLSWYDPDGPYPAQDVASSVAAVVLSGLAA